MGSNEIDHVSKKALSNGEVCSAKVSNSVSQFNQPQQGGYLQRLVQSTREQQLLLNTNKHIPPEQLLSKAKECLLMVDNSTLLHYFSLLLIIIYFRVNLHMLREFIKATNTLLYLLNALTEHY